MWASFDIAGRRMIPTRRPRSWRRTCEILSKSDFTAQASRQRCRDKGGLAQRAQSLPLDRGALVDDSAEPLHLEGRGRRVYRV
jgi:hypothetical protein